jgi:hypothetical protein
MADQLVDRWHTPILSNNTRAKRPSGISLRGSDLLVAAIGGTADRSHLFYFQSVSDRAGFAKTLALVSLPVSKVGGY